MKKIYSKFTKDRIRKFQIETYIAVEEDTKYVAKRALNPDAIPHIVRMHQFYEERKERGLYCPAFLSKPETISFDYLNGITLCKEMLNALTLKNEDAFRRCLYTYKEILKACMDEELEIANGNEVAQEFVEVFGEWKFTEPMICSKNLDMDLTFDNIIHESGTDSYKIIDYEWFFSFGLPVKYVVFRAIFAFYLKYASVMKEVVTLEQIYDMFEISEEEILLFEEMNNHFDAYVYGVHGMHQIYEGYKKETIPVKKLLPEETLFLQLFVNDGMLYREDMAVTKPIEGKKVVFTIPIQVEEGNILRIDPLNLSCVLKNLSVQVQLSDDTVHEVQDYEHNAFVSANQFTFLSEDPQLLIKNCYQQSIQKVMISFEILQTGMLELPIRSSMEELQLEKKKLQDELNLIKDSKVYQSLLAKKIDKIMGEIYS